MTITGIVATASTMVELAGLAAQLLDKSKTSKTVETATTYATSALNILSKITEAGQMIQTAQQQGRDISDAEIQQLKDNDDVARAKLELGIQAADTQ